MLMGITTEGSIRIGQIQSGSLQFVVSHVVYGSYGFEPLSPTTPLPLDPAATALVSEVFRKPSPPENTVINAMYAPRGKETTYTTVSGTEFSSIVGEAGLIATVTDAGTTGLPLGYEFLLIQAHLGRVVLSQYDRFSIVFPIEYYPEGVIPSVCPPYEDPAVSYEPPGVGYECSPTTTITYDEPVVEFDGPAIDYEG